MLHASTAYPKLFAQQSTPLYTSSKIFVQLKKFDSLRAAVNSYVNKADKTIQMGVQAENSDDKNVKKTYLDALRSLQKDHDNIVNLSTRELINAISKNKYQRFLSLVNSSMEFYKNKPSINKKIMTYYENNKGKERSAVLEKIIQDDKNYEKVYLTIKHPAYNSNSNVQRTTSKGNHKKIVLLSRPGCPYCVKTKAVLKSRGVAYKEYNIQESYGASLFKKHKGTGVPILIVGNKVLRGFSKQAILDAL